MSRNLISRWRQPGDELRTNIPALYDDDTYNNLSAAGYFVNHVSGSTRLYGYSMYDYSSARVCSTDNFRMKSLSLGYNFSPTALAKYGISVLSIHAQVQNLFLIANSRWNGSDPELGAAATSSLPRTFSAGVNITF